jgi:hypothetical protein
MSEVKVNKISPRSGTTVTLGDSGDTFTIPSGATITNNGTAVNFGATGSASWSTTVKTGDFTAVAGEGYFVDTTSGAITVSLPAGVAGAVVAIKDYAGTFDTNAVTVSPNGSDKIGGDSTSDGTLSTEGIAVTFVFVDSTQGWLVTDSGLQNELPTAQFVTASGGTPTTSPCGNFKIHTFTGPGTFTVSCAGNSAGSNTIEYLVVAGGGSGSAKGPGDAGGGGGAGGFRFASPTLAPATYPAKPLAGPAALPVAAQGYPVTVGAGGAGSGNPGGPCANNGNGANGADSVFAGSSTITSTGGGRGGYNGTRLCGTGFPGGSGGGAMSGTGVPSPAIAAGAGNTPPVSPPQGNPGGTFDHAGSGPNSEAAGGGGAISAAPNSVGGNTPYPGGAGGGFPNAFGTSGQNCGSFYYFAGGGGAGAYSASPTGGLGGGGNVSTAGTANTGGGGGGGKGGPGSAAGNSGGSGIVIIRYRFQ